ncbi:putative PEP-binding protein [Catellatospora paridis]|uniref:putative PEP-binding protein n=1 Tax=Catellatospora paridis TaxID=1617086 RepID=UPI0012D3A97B|nr:putative PEP-binding protein [Catellatospora paridis]
MRPEVYCGVAGAPGVAVGRLRHLAYGTNGESVSATPDQVGAAFDAVAARLRCTAQNMRARGDSGTPADILEATALIADDPDLRSAAIGGVENNTPADRAVLDAAERYAGVLAALSDPTLAARAADVRQIGRRVVEQLRSGVGQPTGPGDEPVILVAEELGADDLLDPAVPVVGGVSRLGGPNAHVAIVARALGVPLLFGVNVPASSAGREAVLDAVVATLTVSPTTHRVEAARRAATAARLRREELAALRDQPAVTRDGTPVTLLVNVSTAADAVAGLAAGAQGSGLIRTEVAFLHTAHWPTRSEHAAALRPVLAALAGHRATVRTLDFAPDKLPPFLWGTSSRHRGLELMLDTPQTLADQFAAILDEADGALLRVMIPMVVSVAQLDRCRELLDAAAAERGVPSPPLGAMIELPEAVVVIDELAAAADFLSIGSNDLTASLLGLDRRDPALTPGRIADPVVLAAVVAVVRAGRRHDRDVSVCGDAAGDPALVPLLLSTGCRTLSAAPTALDEVRAVVRDTTLDPSRPDDIKPI